METGTFANKVDYPAGDAPASVFCTDLDDDGYNDLAVANRFANTVSVSLNNGDGTFSPKVDYAAGDAPNSVFSVDFDRDGDNDLAVADFYGNTASVLKAL